MHFLFPDYVHAQNSTLWISDLEVTKKPNTFWTVSSSQQIWICFRRIRELTKLKHSLTNVLPLWTWEIACSVAAGSRHGGAAGATTAGSATPRLSSRAHLRRRGFWRASSSSPTAARWTRSVSTVAASGERRSSCGGCTGTSRDASSASTCRFASGVGSAVWPPRQSWCRRRKWNGSERLNRTGQKRKNRKDWYARETRSGGRRWWSGWRRLKLKRRKRWKNKPLTVAGNCEICRLARAFAWLVRLIF